VEMKRGAGKKEKNQLEEEKKYKKY